MNAAPRGHTKSTCFSVHYPLKRIEEDKNIRILLVSNAAPQSEGFLREIVGHIERDQAYVDFAGQLKPEKPEKWTSREIIIERDRFDLKDPTISTVGYGGTILAKRADEIIIDDLLNPENTKTLEQRQKLKDWFFTVLLPVLRPGGRVIFVGTVWHQEDLLHELLSDPMWDYRKKFQAIIKEPDRIDLWDEWYGIRLEGTIESKLKADEFLAANYDEMHKGVQVLWPGVFTYQMLYTLRRANKVAFEKAYQNNIISREDQKFKEEWLEAAKLRGANYRFIKDLSIDQRNEFKILTVGIDLASSEKTQSDDIVFLTLGVRRMDEMIQILNIERGKYTPGTTRNMAGDHGDHFRPDIMMVENNGYQNAMKVDLAEKNLPIQGFTTSGEKFDPFVGVESMAILFENNRFILPYDKSDPTTIALIDQLVDELRAFPGGHTGDSAMALWFATTAMRSLVPSGTSGFLSMINEDLNRAKEAASTVNSEMSAWVQMTRQ